MQSQPTWKVKAGVSQVQGKFELQNKTLTQIFKKKERKREGERGQGRREGAKCISYFYAATV